MQEINLSIFKGRPEWESRLMTTKIMFWEVSLKLKIGFGQQETRQRALHIIGADSKGPEKEMDQ